MMKRLYSSFYCPSMPWFELLGFALLILVGHHH